MNFWQFLNLRPVLSFFIIFIFCATIIDVVHSLSTKTVECKHGWVVPK